VSWKRAGSGVMAWARSRGASILNPGTLAGAPWVPEAHAQTLVFVERCDHSYHLDGISHRLDLARVAQGRE
jgi:hypothetical protein